MAVVVDYRFLVSRDYANVIGGLRFYQIVLEQQGALRKGPGVPLGSELKFRLGREGVYFC